VFNDGRLMLLFEVIRWGNASDDAVTGGADGADTCFLVRADSVEQAVTLAERELRFLESEAVSRWAAAVYLVGTDLSTQTQAQILRGPYIQHAYRHDWRHWYREAHHEPWVERTDD
jgi:hypothetical protein